MWRVFVLAMVACGSSPSTPPASGSGSAVPDDAVALAIVYYGGEVWIGNDKHEPDEAAQYRGVLEALRAGFAASPPKLPSGSQLVVITYAQQPSIKLPMGPVERFDAALFGRQVDYRGNGEGDLAAALELAASQLATAAPRKRLLVVIGDNHVMSHATPERVVEIRRRVVATNARVYLFKMGGSPHQFGETTPEGWRMKNVTTLSRLGDELAAVWASVASAP